MRRVSAWLLVLGEQLDCTLNVLLLWFASPPARRNQSISEHAAEAQAQRRLWGCLLCRWLALTVQRHHCTRTLQGEAITRAGALLAAVQLVAVACLLIGIAQGSTPTILAALTAAIGCFLGWF